MSHVLTNAKPREVNGVTFRCYQTSVMTEQWKSDGGVYVCGWNPSGTYWASHNGNLVGRRFRTLRGAMAAAIRGRHK